MDKETLAKLGGTVDWIEVPYNTNMSMKTEDGKWESAGVEARMRVTVGAEADPGDVYRASYEWLKTLAKETAGVEMQRIIRARKGSVGQATTPETSGGQDEDEEPRYDGEQPEGSTMITVSKIYIHQGKKGRCAYVHGLPGYDEKGVVAFKDDLTKVDLNIDALTAGRTYSAEDLGVSRAVIVGEGKDAKISELIK